jgi:hypothetical protein
MSVMLKSCSGSTQQSLHRAAAATH